MKRLADAAINDKPINDKLIDTQTIKVEVYEFSLNFFLVKLLS